MIARVTLTLLLLGSVLILSLFPGESCDLNITSVLTFSQKDLPTLMMEIYKEVYELGYRDHEDFIKREFHMNLDGRWDNREEHIVVLSHKEGAGEKMILQVTYFGKMMKSSFARYAKDTREIVGLISNGTIDIIKCGFNECETKTLLPDILEGIKDEKRLLQLIRN